VKPWILAAFLCSAAWICDPLDSRGVRVESPKSATKVAFGGSLPSGSDTCANAAHNAQPPHLSRLARDSISFTAIAAGGVIEVEVDGCKFDAMRNSVSFGPVTLRNVASSAGGTRLRFVLPTQVPSSGEVPPQQIGAGTYRVLVTTPCGTSNSLPFTITLR